MGLFFIFAHYNRRRYQILPKTNKILEIKIVGKIRKKTIFSVKNHNRI